MKGRNREVGGPKKEKRENLSSGRLWHSPPPPFPNDKWQSFQYEVANGFQIKDSEIKLASVDSVMRADFLRTFLYRIGLKISVEDNNNIRVYMATLRYVL